MIGTKVVSTNDLIQRIHVTKAVIRLWVFVSFRVGYSLMSPIWLRSHSCLQEGAEIEMMVFATIATK